MRGSLPTKPVLLAASAASLVAGVLLVSSFLRLGGTRSIYSSFSRAVTGTVGSSASLTAEDLTATILHYATSSVTPQQSRSEIQISYNVLRARSPCNFLVFGLGHDSRMWQSFNPGGKTVFLEEDPKWVRSVLKDTPTLRAHTVRYGTQLKDADDLLDTWHAEPSCAPSRAALRGNYKCRLALSDLPSEIYEEEWDLIMIDAPRGYFPEAPGRMAAIYSAAVMARSRKGKGETDVFLHDVDRKVEKTFAMEFLCKKYLVEGKGRLWHFRIPSVTTTADTDEDKFC